MDMLGDMNLSLVFAAIGSAFGVRAAGMSAIGSWKKAYMENKPTPFLMVTYESVALQLKISMMLILKLNVRLLLGLTTPLHITLGSS